jgi:RNA polymerase sigma-70 factor (ECF subfamily)
MGEFSKHTDTQLVALVAQGDMGAFAQVYDRYWDKLYNSAHKRLNNDAACEEIVQDIFVRYWEKRNSLNLNTGLSNYLFTAVRYSVIDFYRKSVIRQNFANSGIMDHQTDNSNEEHMMLKDLVALIESVVLALPEKCRQVYNLSRVEFKSNHEIAIQLNISEKTVEGHLTRALSSLRKMIRELSPILLLVLLKKY